MLIWRHHSEKVRKEERQENQRKQSRRGRGGPDWKCKGRGGRKEWAEEKFRDSDPRIGVSFGCGGEEESRRGPRLGRGAVDCIVFSPDVCGDCLTPSVTLLADRAFGRSLR